MANSITPTNEYLLKYASPLWQILGFENLKVLSIVEGKQDAYPYSIIELEHDANRGIISFKAETEVSMFFIVTLPDNARRRITWHPADSHVSADSQHVYLTLPGERVRPRDWKQTLQQTIKVAKTLADGVPDTGKYHGAKPTFAQTGWKVLADTITNRILMHLLFSSVFFGLGVTIALLGFDPAKCGSQPANIRDGGCELQFLIYKYGGLFGVGLAYLMYGLFIYYRVRKRREIDSKRI